MDRLTYWNEEYGCWSYHGASGDAAKRLADYEDTGYEPRQFEDCVDAMKAALYDLQTELKVYKALGDLSHLRELVKAEKDGRLVVLPTEDYTFKIRGDIVRGIIIANCRAARLEGEGHGN